jgi:N-acetylmuramic acid 6-phosphate (MurNAc-6-P) etherase
VPPRAAERLLKASGASAKVAIAMARLGVDAPEARRRLKHAAGSLRQALD